MDAGIRTEALRKVYPASRAGGRITVRGVPVGARGAAVAVRGVPGGAPGSRHGGDGIVALEGLDLEIRPGEFFGLLGPNGAGKTTTLGILTTRVRPTSGRAVVAGAEIARDDVGVRQRIGVVPQRPNPDRSLDAFENLLFHAAYFGIPRRQATRRAHELLERFGLGDRRTARVDQLSGGQQQRLMIARALIHEPRVLFLDEPTVGLDPQARLQLWEILRELHRAGRTIVMTTHYMEEADRLCERVAIVDRGRLLACDTPAALKALAPGGTLIELTLAGESGAVMAAARALPGVLRVEAAGPVLRVYAERAGETLGPLARAAEEAGRAVVHVDLAPPSLETLFVSMTGRKLD